MKSRRDMDRVSLQKKIILLQQRIKIKRHAEEKYKNLNKLWDYFDAQSRTKIRCNPPDAIEAFVLRLLAVQYAILSLTVDWHKGAENFLYARLFQNISNTIIAIMRLAEDGLDYQAISLIRNLFELYMVLIIVTESTEKRKEFISAHEPEVSREVWHRYFTKTKFLKTMKEFCSNYVDLEKTADIFQAWIEENYRELSSYAHNEYLNIVCGCMSPSGNDESLHPNIWGEYVARRKLIYSQLFAVAFLSHFIFSRMLREPSIEMDLETLLGEKDMNKVGGILSEIERTAFDLGMSRLDECSNLV